MKPLEKCAMILAFALAVVSSAWSAEKPITLIQETRTTLKVGELAVLQVPQDRRYSQFNGKSGAPNVLTIVRRSGRQVFYRAVQSGDGVIIISPQTSEGECISCATLHYFITVVPQN